MTTVSITKGHKTRTFETIDLRNPPVEGTEIYEVGRGDSFAFCIETTPKPRFVKILERITSRLSTERS